MEHAPSYDLPAVVTAASYVEAGMADVEATLELSLELAPGERWRPLVLAGQEEVLAEILGFRGPRPPEIKAVDGALGALPAGVPGLFSLRFTGDLWAMPEGSVAFPGEPVVRITGSLPTVTLLQDLLRWVVPSATALASHTAELAAAAGSLPLFDLGIHHVAGAGGARATAVGGCMASSELNVSWIPGIAPTNAQHVLAHYSEEVAFSSFCRAAKEGAFLAIDAYDPVRGATRAAQSGPIRGVRLDRDGAGSRPEAGEFAEVLRAVRGALDAAARADAQILLCGDLDPADVSQLVAADAPLSALGATEATAMPHLCARVELTSFTTPGGRPQPVVRLLGEEGSTFPGPRQVWRQVDDDFRVTGDVIGLADEDDHGSPLLVPMIRAGKRVDSPPSLADVQHGVRSALEDLPADVPVTQSSALESLRNRLVAQRKSEI